MQAVRGIKPTNLLHTTPVRGSALLAAICLFILFHPICIAGTTPTTADAMLTKAQALIDKAAAKATGVSAVPLYDEPLKLLEEITTRYPDEKEANIQAEKLKALCLDKQAKYAEKHQALKRYAVLSSAGDTEKAAEILKAETQELVLALEISEVIMIRTIIAQDFSDTSCAPEALFERALAIDQEVARQGARGSAVVEYVRVIERYPDSWFAEKSAAKISMIVYGDKLGYRADQDTVAFLTSYLNVYPKGRCAESLLFSLAEIYRLVDKGSQFRELAERYLREFPVGRYSQYMATRLSEEQ